MTIEYTWTFDTLETIPSQDGLTDVVKIVHWNITGVDSETNISAKMVGRETLSSPDPESFIAFDDITEETVKAWVLGKLRRKNQTSEDVEQNLKDSIVTQIRNKLSPPTEERTPPWI